MVASYTFGAEKKRMVLTASDSGAANTVSNIKVEVFLRNL